MFFAQFSYQTYYFQEEESSAVSQVILYPKVLAMPNATIDYVGFDDDELEKAFRIIVMICAVICISIWLVMLIKDARSIKREK